MQYWKIGHQQTFGQESSLDKDDLYHKVSIANNMMNEMIEANFFPL
jgi:hypothetical protein